jgi:hypothetical protein
VRPATQGNVGNQTDAREQAYAQLSSSIRKMQANRFALNQKGKIK